MTNKQWDELINVLKGSAVNNPIGFIIDSPWLPGWSGINTLDYFSSDQLWFEVNKKAVETFPDIMFIPGFWSEFGMCTEPSAFGAKMIWRERDLPHAERIVLETNEIVNIKKPDVRHDGLLPFMIRRLVRHESDIKRAGHELKFAVSRGPLNIASFLMGTTELMMAITMQREEVIRFLGTITDFIMDWIELQAQTFPTIDGILVLDDLVGFLGEDDFKEIAFPFIKMIYTTFNFSVRLFHNDAFGLVTAKFLNDMNINMFNFSFEHGIEEIRTLTERKVTLLGNLPPRDVLANAIPQEVRRAAYDLRQSVSDLRNIIWSCGGGMPPDVSTANIEAFRDGIRSE